MRRGVARIALDLYRQGRIAGVLCLGGAEGLGARRRGDARAADRRAQAAGQPAGLGPPPLRAASSARAT